MKNKALKFVILLGIVAISGILMIQYYWFQTTKTLKDTEFHQKVQIALFKVAKDIALNNGEPLPKFNVVNQRSSNYYVVNVNSTIQSDWLEYSLLYQLTAAGLDTDFEYSIYDCETNKMVYGNYCDLDKQIPEEKPDYHSKEVTDFSYYFSIRFPNRTTFVWETLDFSVLLMAILFLTMLFFALSLFIVIRQRQQAITQRDWVNNMTHEFKTPLSSLKLVSHYFSKHNVIQKEPKLIKYAEILNAQVQLLEKNLDMLLQIAQVDNTHFELNKETFDLRDAIRQSVHVFAERLPVSALTLDLPPHECLVFADPFHFKNLLNNLLDNSLKYSTNKVSIKIFLKAHDNNDNNSYILTVEDEGDGIEDDYIPYIFNKFSRSSNGDVHNTKGFGIGLFYVKKIVELHHWTISVRSNIGKGTAVNIIIK